MLAKKKGLGEAAASATAAELAVVPARLLAVRVAADHSSNFRRLVLGCMDSYDSDQRLILQGFSKATRLALLHS